MQQKRRRYLVDLLFSAAARHVGLKQRLLRYRGREALVPEGYLAFREALLYRLGGIPINMTGPPYCAMISASSASQSPRAFKTAAPWANMPRGSLTATPILTLPISRATIRRITFLLS